MSGATRLEALAKANAHRARKAAIKQDLKAGRLTLGQLLDDLPACCAQVPAYDALRWLPQVGKVRAHKLATGVITETIPLSCLGPSTRRRLLERVYTETGVSE